MKTFIWNTEFMVHIAVANTIEGAREKVITAYKRHYERDGDFEFGLFDINTQEKIPEVIPPSPKPIDFEMFIKSRLPFILCEETIQAINYYHANE